MSIVIGMFAGLIAFVFVGAVIGIFVDCLSGIEDFFCPARSPCCNARWSEEWQQGPDPARICSKCRKEDVWHNYTP